ncbi:CaiB/BaiF CoA transferase family protein [Hydrogenophaga sp. BPS33]|uniref:CaiB/BaiF CoA transferase family protein n=1 Tax=Hydrogenophaga sp. BPS33 TaxID=2651974 RepID=UPI0013202C4B|nr:CoA transferase [Hydrogenophaga sp. BPS33]QHE87035.1 CoA transferase [Hydrogenophaga sp. BPS33]
MNQKTKNPGDGPLAGVRVLDLSAVISGPFAGQMLAELGADVVKIEPPDGDSQRRIGPARGEGMGHIYMNSNRGKRALGLDLKKPAGRAVLLRLARTADVLLYNMRARAMERLGLSHAVLAETNPRLIFVGLFGFGQDGPYADKPAYDDLIQSAAGVAHIMSRKLSSAPQYVPLALADRNASFNAALAICAALYERERSGLGQRIDIPMFENTVSMVMADHLGGLSFEPALGEGGYARLLAAGRKPYRTQDGYIAAMPFTDRHWRRLYEVIGRADDFERDTRLHTMQSRNQHVDAIYAEFEQLLAGRPSAHWLRVFEEADVPNMPVHDLHSLLEDEHLRAVNFFPKESHPSEGVLRRTRHPNHWSRTPPQPTRPAPRVGEHSDEVLREAGFDAAEIAALVQDGIVAQARMPEAQW